VAQWKDSSTSDRYVVLSTYAIEKEILHYDFRVCKLETFFGEYNINKQPNLDPKSKLYLLPYYLILALQVNWLLKVCIL